MESRDPGNPNQLGQTGRGFGFKFAEGSASRILNILLAFLMPGWFS